MNKRQKQFKRSVFYLVLAAIIIISSRSFYKNIVSAETVKRFVHVSGTEILDENNKTYMAKGIAFGNDVWSNPSVPPSKHHTQESYKELSKLGFNSIRFYLNYGLFEDDEKPYKYKQSGWNWLDKNIAWAKKYNMKLVLNMHYPQGGFQSNGDGMELWTNEENKDRLIALWKEIARRYKNEPVIMAYDLLNEPYVAELESEEETFAQWENLAKRIVTEIRKVDKNHMIIVERLNASKNIDTGKADWNPDRNGDMNFFLIEDDNIAYEFHAYEPMEFTHQNAFWIDGHEGNFTAYPDKDAIKTIGDIQWEGFTDSNPKAERKASGWQYMKGERFKINNPDYMFAQPTLQARNTGKNGTVWFDDITVKEYDEKGIFVREIHSYSFNKLQGWSLWQAGSSKGSGTYDAKEGRKEKGSLRITGTTDDANLSSYVDRIRLKQGYSYEISGYVLTKNIESQAEIRIRLDFYSCDRIYGRDKEYLESIIDQYVEFGKKNNVPLYLGEFGCITYAFQEERGGERFVSDIIDICRDRKISFSFHAYHEEAFGLYQNAANKLPDNINKQLLNVFKKELK